MPTTAEFRRGLRIELDGAPYIIVEFQHVKPGKGGAFVRTKLKNLATSQVLEKTFRSGERVDSPDLEEMEQEFLYYDGQLYHLMNTETYEQTALSDVEVGDARDFLKDNMRITVLYHNGKAISVDVPNHVELVVAKTEPGVRGDTAQGGSKPAELETGVTIQVPLFIDEGDVVRVDTRTREYVTRVKRAG